MRSVRINRPPVQARRGVSIIYLPFILLALLAIAGLAVDWGWVRVVEKQLHDTADGAALAAVRHLPDNLTDARQAAVDVALANRAAGSPVQLATSDVVFGTFSNGNFTPTEASPNAVKVIARRTDTSPNGPLQLFLARALGINDINVQREAIASTRGAATIVLLHPSLEGFKYSGNGHTVVNGGVYINSTYEKALAMSGDGILEAESFDIVGEAFVSSGTLVGPVFEGVDPLPDPLAYLPVPVLADYPIRSTQKLTLGNDTYTLEPGRYQGGIDFSGNGNVTLLPGVYIMEGGGGVKIQGDGSFTANEVIIYNTGVNDTTSGADQFKISGNGPVTWTPPSSGTYKGICLFQNRDLADKKVEISGNGNDSISGMIYAKSAQVYLSGDGDTLGAGIIASQLEISGNASFDVERFDGPTRGVLVK